jgi:uncharacterized membrane protein HdeD (DUF308 family)
MKTILTEKTSLLKYWYIPLVIGLLLILTGLYVFSAPEAATTVMVTIFSLTIIVSSATELFFYFKNRARNKILPIAGAALLLASGVFLLFNPGSATILIALIIAIQLALRSIQGLIFSFKVKAKGVANWYLLAGLSFAGIITSVLLIKNPEIIGVSIVLIAGICFIIAGVICVGLALLAKRFSKMFTSVANQFNRQPIHPADTPFEIVEEKIKD